MPTKRAATSSAHSAWTRKAATPATRKACCGARKGATARRRRWSTASWLKRAWTPRAARSISSSSCRRACARPDAPEHGRRYRHAPAGPDAVDCGEGVRADPARHLAGGPAGVGVPGGHADPGDDAHLHPQADPGGGAVPVAGLVDDGRGGGIRPAGDRHGRRHGIGMIGLQLAVVAWMLATLRFVPVLLMPAFTPFAWAPLHVRAILLLALSWLLTGVAAPSALPADLVLAACSELLVGACYGLAVTLPMASLGFSARMLDVQAGLASAKPFHPALQRSEERRVGTEGRSRW